MTPPRTTTPTRSVPQRTAVVTPPPAPPAVKAPPEVPDIPPLPPIPSTWTPATIIAFVGAAAAFLLGILTTTGHLLPSDVSANVQTILGSVVSLAGAIAPLFVLSSKNKVARAALAAGEPLHRALKA